MFLWSLKSTKSQGTDGAQGKTLNDQKTHLWLLFLHKTTTGVT